MNTTAQNQPVAANPATVVKLPYGISNFEALITEGYVYIDKTRFIELFEHESNPYQLFIRPRKFGKSLFFTMLFSYYDMNYADKFETLFKGLYIGEHPTPKHNHFTMLNFDFSGLNTNRAEKFEASFYNRIRDRLVDFVETYRHLFRNSDKLLEANGLVRDFYEKLKADTKSVVSRIFLTGISPMTINDLTSGFNIADNLTLEERYNEMLGFMQKEVDALIDISGMDRALITIDIARYYNGYLFSEDAETRVYNPNMALYFLRQIFMTKRPSISLTTTCAPTIPACAVSPKTSITVRFCWIL
jgi:hypothetical protein